MGQNFKFAPNLKGWFGILALTQHFLIKIKRISKKETYAASHFKKLNFWAFFTILPVSPSKPPNTAKKQFYPLFNFFPNYHQFQKSFNSGVVLHIHVYNFDVWTFYYSVQIFGNSRDATRHVSCPCARPPSSSPCTVCCRPRPPPPTSSELAMTRIMAHAWGQLLSVAVLSASLPPHLLVIEKTELARHVMVSNGRWWEFRRSCWTNKKLLVTLFKLPGWYKHLKLFPCEWSY